MGLWKDVILLERDKLTSGTTWHAAGLVSQIGPSSTITNIRIPNNVVSAGGRNIAFTNNMNIDVVLTGDDPFDNVTVTASGGAFLIDGVSKPALTLHKGWTYTFDVSDSSNGAHPFRFYAGSSQYSSNVTVTGTQGNAGAKVQIVIPESQPSNFK